MEMKKITSYIVALIVAIQALSPPFEFSIYFLNSPLWFTWTFLICGFFAFMFVFSNANIWFKILIPYLFLNTFLSAMPHFSMTVFFGIIASAYFYLLCKSAEDKALLIKTVFCVLMIQIFLLFLMGMGKETLLNFGYTRGCFGSVGNPMQLKSLIMLCFAFIIASGRPRFIERAPLAIWVFLLSSAVCYAHLNHSFKYFCYARGAVWLQTFALTASHPFIGYGAGTFQHLFPVYGHGHFQAEGVWMHTHNFWLRMLFEAGNIGFALILGYMVSLSKKIRGISLIATSLVLLALFIHFPESQSSAVPLLLLFCASIEKEKPQWIIST